MNDNAVIATLFDQVPVSHAARDRVRELMAGPDRHYHGTRHLAWLWRCHGRYGAGVSVTQAPWHRLIASAIAFHDAIYDPRGRDNEARSAELWRASRPACEAWEIDWVTGTILATANHLGAVPEPGMTGEAWAARQWMLDLDLTPLGAETTVSIANTAEIRAEYAHLDDAAWTSGRRAFMRALSRHPVLFRTPVLATAFEARARANVARELAALN